MKKPIITFQKSLARNILKAFGKGVDSENYLVERGTSKRVLSRNGEEVRLNEFAGVTRGSEIYLKSDITSLIDFVEKR